MNKITLLYILVIGLILANVYFFFQESHIGKGPHSPMHPDFKQEVINELHFDKKQSESFELLAKAHHDRIQSLEDSIVDAKEAYYLSALKNVDSAQAERNLKLILQLHGKMESVNIAHFKEIKALCKSDQLKDFDRMIPRFAKFFRRTSSPPPPHP